MNPVISCLLILTIRSACHCSMFYHFRVNIQSSTGCLGLSFRKRKRWWADWAIWGTLGKWSADFCAVGISHTQKLQQSLQQVMVNATSHTWIKSNQSHPFMDFLWIDLWEKYEKYVDIIIITITIIQQFNNNNNNNHSNCTRLILPRVNFHSYFFITPEVSPMG